MSSFCEQHHHFMSSKTAPKDINLPPRKLLNRSKHLNEEISSPRTPNLNILTDGYEEETDPYSSDEFRMYEFKIRRCMRSRSHDWTDCPFAHPGEKARRRDPRRFHYSGNPCADFRHGTCPRGDSCEFAHGVFECWLHPARYRTHACKDGKKCTRKVCFFAHTPGQLRVLPLCSQSPCSSNMCTGFCQSMATSPTSTLMGLSQSSPPSSPNQTPPISPTTARKASVDSTGNYSLLQKFNEASLFSPSAAKRTLTNYLSYKNALLMELVNSLENLDMSCLDYDDQQTQFFMSPTATTSKGFGGGRDVFSDQDYMPDLEWVNELVM